MQKNKRLQPNKVEGGIGKRRLGGKQREKGVNTFRKTVLWLSVNRSHWRKNPIFLEGLKKQGGNREQEEEGCCKNRCPHSYHDVMKLTWGKVCRKDMHKSSNTFLFFSGDHLWVLWNSVVCHLKVSPYPCSSSTLRPDQSPYLWVLFYASPAGSWALRQKPVYTNGSLGVLPQKQIAVGEVNRI